MVYAFPSPPCILHVPPNLISLIITYLRKSANYEVCDYVILLISLWLPPP
jgi:hypothetical protein